MKEEGEELVRNSRLVFARHFCAAYQKERKKQREEEESG